MAFIMTHVAILFEFPTLNGGEQSMLAVLEHVRSNAGFRFTAIAPSSGPLAERLAELQISLRRFDVRDEAGTRRSASDLQRELASLVGDIQPDLLHANSLSMCRLTGQLSPDLGILCCRTGHLRDIIKLNATVIRDLNQNNGLIAVSHATRDFHTAQGLDESRCHVIHNGVDTNRFQKSSDHSLRSRLLPDVPIDHKVVLNVGQICLRKGQLLAAQAVCNVLSNRRDVHLVLVGERHSAKQETIEFEDAIRNEFASRGLAHHLHMMGYRSDVADLMNAADLLVHAAHQEPFGRTLLEAASCGLHIAATSVGGTAEMLRPSTDAILIPSRDIQAMADAIETILSSPQDARQLSKSAQNRVATHFRIEHAAENLGRFWLTASESFRMERTISKL